LKKTNNWQGPWRQRAAEGNVLERSETAALYESKRERERGRERDSKQFEMEPEQNRIYNGALRSWPGGLVHRILGAVCHVGDKSVRRWCGHVVADEQKSRLELMNSSMVD
jgi:hypothetical protein